MKIRLVFWFIRLVLPWIGRFVFLVVHLVLITVASLWVGVPEACRSMAREWSKRAEKSGFPSIYLPHLYKVLGVVAFLVILFSWIVFAYITVFIVGLIL